MSTRRSETDRMFVFVTISTLVLVAVAAFSLTAVPACAQPTRFAAVAEAPVFGPGEGEVTHAAGYAPAGGGRSGGDAAWQMAVDYGVRDRLQVGFALPALEMSWDGSTSQTRWLGMSAWGLWGAVADEQRGFYLSLGAGFAETGDAACADVMLLVQKDLGSAWTLASNTMLGNRWGRDETVLRCGALAQSLGVSRRLTERVYLGGEFLFEQEIVEWADWRRANAHAGPTVAAENALGWIALSVTRQVVGEGTADAPVAFNAVLGMPF